MADPRAAGKDSLGALVNALRPPIDYVAGAGSAAAARTRFDAAAFAARCRSLAAHVAHPSLREPLARLGQELETYEGAPADERIRIAERCRALLSRITETEVGPPPYRPTVDDPEAALKALAAPIRFVAGVGPRLAPELERFGLATVEDLVYHLPFRYEDRRRVRRIAELSLGESVSVVGDLVQLQQRTVGRSRRRIQEGVLRDETGLLGLTWYNPVRYRTGQRYRAYGTVEASSGGGRRMIHPEMEGVGEREEAGILPVYNKPGRISLRQMRKIVRQVAEKIADTVPSVIPPPLAQRARVTDLATALRAVHLPDADADLDELNRASSLAHRSLAFDELFFLQLGMLLRRRATQQESGLALAKRGHLTDRVLATLPFALTGAQRRVIAEIEADMAAPRPMHRLVQGDVGSGKTVVALFAALVAVENGLQAAFVAPTELLAEQHFRTVSGLLEGLAPRVVLLTGSASRGERRRLHAALAEREIDIVIGTHALIQEEVRMPALGLGVIDEQHRFGVLQRAAVRRLRGEGAGPAPDILLMSATPIPRTLAMTLYGDLDVSLLDELPPGRAPVQTRVCGEGQRQWAYKLVKGELDRGRQGYVVYPLVEASEKEDLRDATTMARELARAVFANYRVGLLHGRMKGEEKEAVMRRFRAGDLQLLVSTTVIEVGVDVPNASILVVEHAERFGLAQLHQLRGRVGRGTQPALCLLVAAHGHDSEAEARLRAFSHTTDGFEIAEIDLRFRGPGEFLGTRQSGLPDFRVASLVRDSRLLVDARQAAEECLAGSGDLRGPESTALARVLAHRWAGRLGLAEIGGVVIPVGHPEG